MSSWCLGFLVCCEDGRSGRASTPVIMPKRIQLQEQRNLTGCSLVSLSTSLCISLVSLSVGISLCNSLVVSLSIGIYLCTSAYICAYLCISLLESLSIGLYLCISVYICGYLCIFLLISLCWYLSLYRNA
jgi:hypothetical protein